MTTVTDVSSLISFIRYLMNAALPILIGLAVIFFIYSLLTFLMSAGSAKDQARSQMIWGIVILFVMVSVWGLVKVFQNSLGNQNQVPSVSNMLPTSSY